MPVIHAQASVFGMPPFTSFGIAAVERVHVMAEVLSAQQAGRLRGARQGGEERGRAQQPRDAPAGHTLPGVGWTHGLR